MGCDLVGKDGGFVGVLGGRSGSCCRIVSGACDDGLSDDHKAPFSVNAADRSDDDRQGLIVKIEAKVQGRKCERCDVDNATAERFERAIGANEDFFGRA